MVPERVLDDLETPNWLVAETPLVLSGRCAEEFERRQFITRLTFNRYRMILHAMPANLRPHIPTRDEAQLLPKRAWETIFGLWRSQLRDACGQHGDIDESLDALTVDLQIALDREASR
tara:strand:- start:758 stop:1111 length:354 start_codon:yes stop_codon:yes gene_type:complete